MSRRLNLTRVAVVPWQFPDLDGPVEPVPEDACGSPDAPVAVEGKPVPAEAVHDAKPETQIPPEQIEQVLAAAQAEGFARGMAEGRQEGYTAGFAEGRDAAQQRLAEQVQRLDAILGKLGEPIRALEKPVEEAVIALALEVARRVIGAEVSRSRKPLLRLIREAIGKVPIDLGAPKILLAPADVELIRSLAPDLESAGVTLVSDESLDVGGCRVVAGDAEGPTMKDRRWHPRGQDGVSQVDLTLASRWREIMLTLFDGEAG